MTAFSFQFSTLILYSGEVSGRRANCTIFIENFRHFDYCFFIIYLVYYNYRKGVDIKKKLRFFPSFFKIKLDFFRNLCYNNYRKKERWS